MPTYEYRCEECDTRLEVFAAMSDPPPAACEACGSSKLVKVLFPVAVHYKGSGFYSTDYAGTKASAPSASSDASSSSDSTSSSDSASSSSSDSASKPAESKPAPAKSDSGSTASSNS